MNLSSFLKAAASVASVFVLIGPATGQGTIVVGGPQGGPGGPGGPGGQGGPGRILLGGPGGGPMVMPSFRSVLSLLRRPDVQNHLSLSLKQKQTLAELLDNPKPRTIRFEANDTTARDPEAIRKSIEEQVRNQLSGEEQQVKDALTPEQFNRLRQLELQWKGALSLADQRVADRLKISQEARQPIQKAAQEYNQTKMQTLMDLAHTQTDNNGQGAVRVGIRMNANPKELENPLSPQYKKLDAAKKEAEGKILAALSLAERTAWNEALGAPFTFRKDLPGNRF
jgi:hypothetical protein